MSTGTSVEQVRAILAKGHAGYSVQQIADSVGISYTGAYNILHGRTRANVAPELPRLPIVPKPPRLEPRPKTGNCRTCNHWDEELFGQRKRYGGEKERRNPCQLGIAEAGKSRAWRFGTQCMSHSALAVSPE